MSDAAPDPGATPPPDTTPASNTPPARGTTPDGGCETAAEAGQDLRFRYDDGTEIIVNMPDAATLVAAAQDRLTRGAGFALATINLDHLVKLRQSAAFRTAYAAQDFVVADGNPIVWLGRLAGADLALVPGSDMVLPLARAAAQADRPLVLLGATDETLSAAGDVLCQQVPGLRIADRIAPPYGFDPAGAEADAILARVAAHGPVLCLIALGAPKQEVLAARGREHAPQAGFASIGAGLDFLAGSQQRAPVWVRRIAMEWAWRMVSNPGRLVRRYAACAAILPAEAMAARGQRP